MHKAQPYSRIRICMTRLNRALDLVTAPCIHVPTNKTPCTQPTSRSQRAGAWLGRPRWPLLIIRDIAVSAKTALRSTCALVRSRGVCEGVKTTCWWQECEVLDRANCDMFNGLARMARCSQQHVGGVAMPRHPYMTTAWSGCRDGGIGGCDVNARSKWTSKRLRSTAAAAAVAPRGDVQSHPSALSQLEWSAGSVRCSFDSIIEDVVRVTHRHVPNTLRPCPMQRVFMISLNPLTLVGVLRVCSRRGGNVHIGTDSRRYGGRSHAHQPKKTAVKGKGKGGCGAFDPPTHPPTSFPASLSRCSSLSGCTFSDALRVTAYCILSQA